MTAIELPKGEFVAGGQDLSYQVSIGWAGGHGDGRVTKSVTMTMRFAGGRPESTPIPPLRLGSAWWPTAALVKNGE